MAEVKGQSQTPAQNGYFIHGDSLAGQKVQFVEPTNTSSGSVTIAAGTGGAIGIGLTLYDRDIPSAARTSQNKIAFADCVAWIYTDIFIDNNNDFNYAIGTGGSLSAGQAKVTAGGYMFHTPATGYSHSYVLDLYNGDSSSHTIYVNAFFKYIDYSKGTI